MHELLTNRDALAGLILVSLVASGGISVFFANVGIAIRDWMKARDRRTADEQEHRQALERAAERKASRLAVAEKLGEVVAIAVADRSVAGEIDTQLAKYPHLVRVANADADDEDEPQTRSRKKKNR